MRFPYYFNLEEIFSGLTFKVMENFYFYDTFSTLLNAISTKSSFFFLSIFIVLDVNIFCLGMLLDK